MNYEFLSLVRYHLDHLWPTVILLEDLDVSQGNFGKLSRSSYLHSLTEPTYHFGIEVEVVILCQDIRCEIVIYKEGSK